MSDKCRERFEEHYRLTYNMTRSGSVYVSSVTTKLWRSWQAAWAASREEAAKEQSLTFEELSHMADIVDNDKWDELAEDANAD